MIGGGAGTVITGALIMGALAYKAVDLVKYLIALSRLLILERKDTSQDHKNAVSDAWSGLSTLLLGCGAGVGVVFLMANTTWSDEIQLGGQTLKTLPSTSLVVLGLVITSLAALLFDAKKAVDGTDSASTPKLTTTADKNRRARVSAKLGMSQDFIDHEVRNVLHFFKGGNGGPPPSPPGGGADATTRPPVKQT